MNNKILIRPEQLMAAQILNEDLHLSKIRKAPKDKYIEKALKK